MNALSQPPLDRGPWTATSLHAGPVASHLLFNESCACPEKTVAAATLLTSADLAFLVMLRAWGQGKQGIFWQLKVKAPGDCKGRLRCKEVHGVTKTPWSHGALSQGMRLIVPGTLYKQKGSKGSILLSCLVGLAVAPLKSTFNSLRSQSAAFAGRDHKRCLLESSFGLAWWATQIVFIYVRIGCW